MLHYDDKVSQHLKDFQDPNAAVPDNTTIADLLGHRTGLQAAESVLTGYEGRVCLPRDEIIAAYHNLKRLAEPRSRFIHGAINYALLEAIIDECCPEGYWKYLKDNVFGALGMHSGHEHFPELRGSLADETIAEPYYVGRRGQELPLERVDCLDSDLAPDLPSLKLDKAFPTNDLESLPSDCKDKASSADDSEPPPSYCSGEASSTQDFGPPPSYCKDNTSSTDNSESLRSNRLDNAFPTNGFKSVRSYCRRQCQDRLSSLLSNDPLIAEKDNPGSRHLSTYRKQQAMAEEMISLQSATMQDMTRGVVSSLDDLIGFCIGLNLAADKAIDRHSDGWKHAFPDVDLLFNPLQAMPGDSNDGDAKSTRSYAAGWATTKLPGRLQGLGINSKLVSMPVIGLGQTAASKVYWNQGVHSGSNCFIALLPETKSTVIVLTNTRTANDAADWIGQYLLRTLVGGRFYEHLPFVKTSMNRARKQHDALFKNFHLYFDKKSSFWGSSNRPLEQYMGMYASSSDKRITLIVWPET
ncbi:hypothetical protein ACHAPE_005930 [Trichoderma viride]